MEIQKSKIPKEKQQRLNPRKKSSRCPKLYGVPKIHKEGVSLQSVVSSVGLQLQNVVRHIAKMLQPQAENAKSQMQDSRHLVRMLDTITTDPGDLLVSFDIVLLFTNIPTKEALEVIKQRCNPGEDIMTLIQHCLSNTYFIYNGQRYRQMEGAPMGSPLSPVIPTFLWMNLKKKQ